VTISEEAGRQRRIFDSLQQPHTLRLFLTKWFKDGHYLMYVADNLDWRALVNRMHTYEHSGGSTDMHILNRQLNIMFRPKWLSRPAFEQLSDIWPPRHELSYEECTEVLRSETDPWEDEAGAELTFIKAQLRGLADIFLTEAKEAEVLAFQQLQAKRPLQPEQAETTRTDLRSRQERTRIYRIDAAGKEIMESGAIIHEVDSATARIPTRLQRNLEKLDTWVKSQVNAPALAQDQLTCDWPTCAVVAGDVMQVIYALETAFVIRKEGEGNAYLIPDGVLFESPGSLTSALSRTRRKRSR
jgi:hypothetical protein